MKKIKCKIIAIMALLFIGVGFCSLDVFAKNFGIEYSGGVKFSTSNINVNSGLVSGLKTLLTRANIKNTNFKPTSGYHRWINGYAISGSSSHRCYAAKFFRLTATGVSADEKIGFTISDGNYVIDAEFKEISTEGWNKSMITSVNIANEGSFSLDVGREMFSDSQCTKTISVDGDQVQDWGSGGKAFIRVHLTVRRKNETAPLVSNDLYFRLSDIDGGQSYKIMNSDNLLSTSNMFTNDLNGLNKIDNRFNKSGHYVYNIDGDATDNTANIWVKLTEKTQREGLDIVFGFDGQAGSGIEFYGPNNSFQGSIQVGDKNGSKKVGPRSDSAKGETYYINNCSPTTGCQVTFKHAVERKTGNTETSYKVSRTSNYDEKGVGDNSNLKNGNTSGGKMSYSDGPLTLYPGQTVCEKLTFKPTDASGNSVLEICASALGNAQPNDPPAPTPGDDAESDAFIDIQVKNKSGLDKYKYFQKEVYAKPGHVLTYRATYNPILQYAYFIDGLKDKISNWNNAFAIYSKVSGDAYNAGLRSFFSNNYTYTLGKTEKQRESNDYTVPTRAVGGTLIETAITNYNDGVKNTPIQITFTKNSNGTNTGTINIGQKSSSAQALVPYNFNTDIPDVPKPDDDKIYAGEDTPIKYPIEVVPKPNDTTGKEGDDDYEYATIVRDAKVKVIVYIPTTDEVDPGTDSYAGDNICAHYGRTNDGDTCKYIYEANRNLNPDGIMEGAKTNIQATMREDRPAGTRICVAAAVYPANSGADTNLDKKGNDRWRISESTCYTVAKKPTFQIWGGGFYSAGTANTLSTAKTITQGSESQKIVFSSWAERDVITNGLNNVLASGAATGLASNLAGGGSVETRPNFCQYRTPLSLANNGARVLSICPNYQLTGMASISADAVDIEELIGELGVNQGGIDYIDNITIGDEVGIANGQTYVARTSGNVTINANIIYNQMDSASLNSLENIPKAFIYANNITIGCNVERIDAILIANGTVETCNPGYEDKGNARERSNQLVVNGAIITNRLDLGRTFGAYTREYTKIPAEIVNYDTSVLLWAKDKQRTNGYNSLTSVYTHELAPRR